MLRQHSPKKHVDISNGQRPAPSVTCWTMIGTGALRSYKKPHPIKATNTAATGGHGFNGQHRRDDSNSCLLGFKLQLVPAVKSRHVRAGSSHIKADRFFEPGLTGDV